MLRAGIAILVLLVVCASSENPAANKPWTFIHLRATVSPNTKGIPFSDVLPKKIPNSSLGTKTVPNCGVPVFSNSEERGKNTRIVGGDEVVPHSFPWQAGIFIDIIYFCGGSLINEEYVLTAAHCLYQRASAEVTLGAHNLQQSESTQYTLTSTDLIVEGAYNPFAIHNDVGLVHLPELIVYTDNILPICLPRHSDTTLTPGTIVTLSGWGLTSDSDITISDTLNAVSVPIYDHDLCNDYFGTVNDGIICVDTTGDHGGCEGDSGGPMNYEVDGVFVVRGIGSFGSPAGCDAGAPDAFTKVQYYLQWISTNTGIAIDP